MNCNDEVYECISNFISNSLNDYFLIGIKFDLHQEVIDLINATKNIIIDKYFPHECFN